VMALFSESSLRLLTRAALFNPLTREINAPKLTEENDQAV